MLAALGVGKRKPRWASAQASVDNATLSASVYEASKTEGRCMRMLTAFMVVALTQCLSSTAMAAKVCSVDTEPLAGR